jgi:hypothetical protein
MSRLMLDVATLDHDQAVGLAMAPAVIRDGVLKVHIVMHAGLAVGLMDQGSELYQLALHALAHECAHVEVTAKLDAAFPGFVLQHRHSDLHENLRWQSITACWDEYAAACISAPFGQDPTSEYEATFLTVLASARDNANELIKAYRLHGENGRIMGEVYSCYGDLMKFACYHLGNMAGRDLSLEELPETKAALEGHWYKPHFGRLKALCEELAAEYGRWRNTSKFEAIGDLADELVRDGGLTVVHSDDGLHIDVPFTSETMPAMGY